jgi:hypothetical protein
MGIIRWVVLGALIGGYVASAIFHKGEVTGVNIEST